MMRAACQETVPISWMPCSDGLFPEQVTYAVNHAEDEIVFVDRSLLPIFLPLVPTFTTVKHLVVMDELPRSSGAKIAKGELKADLAKRMRHILVVEMNLGQVVLEVERVAHGMCPVHRVNRVTGEPIPPEQILEKIEEVARS